MIPKRVILLIGSPRGMRSNSYSLGSYLIGRLENRGLKTSTWFTSEVLRSDERTEQFLEELDDANLLVMAFPLYVDSLPAMNIRLMGIIADRSTDSDERKGFVAMINSGFPEAGQNETALAICRQFSLEANMEWLGGLAMGGGMAIGGKPLKDLGGMARNIVKALDTAASDLARGKRVSAQARQRMGLPIVPKFLFIRMGNRMWKKLAKENGVENDLDNTPYQ